MLLRDVRERWGALDVDALRARLAAEGQPPVRAVCITHMPTNGGLLNPAERVGAVSLRSGRGNLGSRGARSEEAP